ncbi:photosynthetic NDH subunit of lumenal location 2, chloroplastic [Ricinus communis]|uniref:Calcium ion binding protein, putative n=1 Tax=Ricinus communis TaxID=3988 RepID=B9S8Z4_RICCO|nr:photosynthetic NDH subunit of lumenal location 2, chloroplastic [Ricinus communis]EEF39955.1 calcium ion binding protein, putative [Ricinus communis]|eukprot:XP_002522463.1 photosynthetic NDH subunit of lumenal location 2, chloroplastic [Ricinus communis]
MNSLLTNTTTTIFHAQSTHHFKHSIPTLKASVSPQETNVTSASRRKIFITTFLATSLAQVQQSPPALAENWGVRSFIWERFFEPDLSPEDSVARIRQTAEGLHSIRNMLETMSWRYVIFYIRLKQSYLSKDLKIAMSTLPKGRWNEYVELANVLVENMAKLDQYVRSPKVYESYLYYEKTLKAIDDVVTYLA